MASRRSWHSRRRPWAGRGRATGSSSTWRPRRATAARAWAGWASSRSRSRRRSGSCGSTCRSATASR
eukprot:5774300-Alexandrium_andersonii.AAC.1